MELRWIQSRLKLWVLVDCVSVRIDQWGLIPDGIHFFLCQWGFMCTVLNFFLLKVGSFFYDFILYELF